jgi:hypothetical protein
MSKCPSDSWMGVNEYGFSIVSSKIYDLNTTITNLKGISNGRLIIQL